MMGLIHHSVRARRVASVGGFTLIELVIIIIILGILASVSIARYGDMTLETRKNACRGALGGLRTAISFWQVHEILNSRPSSWPPIDSLRQVGAVMAQQIPPNPFQSAANAPDSIVLGVTKGVTVGTRGGWAYLPATGEVWANTNSVVPGSGCGGAQNLGENTW
jgi:competence protein ComGC